MFSIRATFAPGLVLLSLLMPPAPCSAQLPPADKAKAADGQPRPFRVLYDRRVDFPLAALTFSRDGKRLAALGATYAVGVQPQYRVVVADVATGQVVRELPCHTSLVNKLVFSPDGKVLYTGSDAHKASYFAYHGNGPLFVWDVDTGKRLKEMSASLWDLSPDGKRIAIVEHLIDDDPGIDGRKLSPSAFTVKVLDTATWKELSRLHEKNAVMSALRFSPDGKTLALSLPNYSIRQWDWQARKERLRFEATKLDEADAKLWGVGQVNVLEYSPDGALLASITAAPPQDLGVPLKIDLWDAASGKLVRRLEGPTTQPTIVAFTPKGDRLAVAALWNHFRLLEVATGKLVQEFGSPGSADLAAALYRHGMTTEQAPNGPPVLQRLWNQASSDDTRSGTMLENPQCLAFAPDDRTLAVGDNNGMIHLVDVVTGKELHKFSDANKTVTGLIFLDGGKLLCSQHLNGGTKFWDPRTGKLQPLRLAAAFPGSFSAFVASPDGKLAAESHGGLVMLWQSFKDQRPRQVRCPAGMQHIEFTPDGKKLLTCALTGNTGKVQVIDVATAKIVSAIGTTEVATFGLVPDGTRVATWGHTISSPWVWDKTVRLWDLSGAARGELPVTPWPNRGLRFTPDSRSLFVTQDDRIGLWEISARQMRTHIPGVGPIAVSSNSRLVVSTGPNCLFVWDLTGRNNGGVLDAGRLTEKELPKLWDDLQAEAGTAYRAMWRLAGAPDQSVPLLKEKAAAMPPPGNSISLRMVEVLEQSRAPEARALLTLLANGERPQFVEAAKAALGRMERLRDSTETQK